MDIYEYKVVPAPKRGQKGKGVKGNEAKFANKLESVINELAADAWEFVRTDTLPAEERQGLTKRITVYQNLLIFRRKKPVSRSPIVEAPVVTPPPEIPEEAKEANVRSIFKTKGVNEAS